MSTMSYAKPPGAKILAFERTKEYPKPGSIISVNSKIIENYINEIEDRRLTDDRIDFGKIVSKLPPINNSKSFFYRTHIEEQFSISADVLLRVDDVISSKKGCRIKCSLRMVNWPSDIEDDHKFIYFNDYDVTVVKVVECSSDWTFSDKKPDNVESFGMLNTKNKFWQIYQKLNYIPEIFVDITIELGFKEFSYIAPVPVGQPNLQPLQKVKEPIQPVIDQEESYIDEEFTEEEDFDIHPMAEFIKRLYEITCSMMASHGIMTTPEFREDLRQKYIKLTNNTDMRIDFYDDDEI